MNLDKFLILICPPIVIVVSISLLALWGAYGDTNEKPERK